MNWWATLKGSAATIIFLVLTILIQVFVVVYAMDLGVTDNGLLTANWPVTFSISPLFELVPIAVILTLLFTWLYVRKKLPAKAAQSPGRTEGQGPRRAELKKPAPKTGQSSKGSPEKAKSAPVEKKEISLWKRLHFANPAIRSALVILLVFLAFVLLVTVLAYPSLIYQTLTGSYQNHSSFYNFVVSVSNSINGFLKAASPIGSFVSAINGGLVAASPAIRSIGLALGSLTAPLANLDGPGKYLAFQNVATWMTVLLALFYGLSPRRRYRYRRK